MPADPLQGDDALLEWRRLGEHDVALVDLLGDKAAEAVVHATLRDGVTSGHALPRFHQSGTERRDVLSGFFLLLTALAYTAAVRPGSPALRSRPWYLASIALRATGETSLNLGLFVEEFTREHGIVGGGHPTSAGAKINSRHLALFLDEVLGNA